MKTYKLGVVGDPINHSLSPKIHHLFAKRANIKIEYEPYHVLPSNLDYFIRDFFDDGGSGLNVTLPHKIDCLNSVDDFSPIVKKIGAANILTRLSDTNQIFADSTDGMGLIKGLMEANINEIKSDILILGAGGAAQSIIHDLQTRFPRVIAIANRTKEKVKPVVSRFPPLDYDNLHPNTQVVDIETYLSEWDVQGFHTLINATSAKEELDFKWCESLPIEGVTNFYDLSYSKLGETTPFLKWAKNQDIGATRKIARDGFGMLIHQAALSFEIWTGIKPDTNITKAELFDE
ncbi:shikimate dehydrogenase [Gammaproteobacteria bacterium]|nr:shikimate dehydrogenase [Gammaproteobacteria bacterium]